MNAWGRRQGSIWQPLGQVEPQMDTDGWGSRTATFEVTRGHDRLQKHDEIDLEKDGTKVWAGRVTNVVEGPSVLYSCEGWQYHLDDELVNAMYVHDRLSDWRDMRGFPKAGLWRTGTTAGQVEVGSGSIMIGWPKGAEVSPTSSPTPASNDTPAVGVVLDLGPNPACWTKAVHIIYSIEAFTSGTGQFFFLVRSASDEGVWDVIDQFEDAISNDPATSSPFPSVENATGTFSEPRRYVAVILAWVGLGYAFGVDITLKLQTIRCFREGAYHSSGASTLLISDVLKDQRQRAMTKLAQTDERVETTSLLLPHFTTEGPASPRQSLAKAAAAEGLQPHVDVERRLALRATPPTTPIFTAVEDKANFEPATQAGGEEAAVNRVVVTATGPDGTALEVARMSAELDDARRQRLTSPSPSNTDFEADVSGWTAVPFNLPEAGNGFGIQHAAVPDTGSNSMRVYNTAADYIRVGERVEAEVIGTHEVGTVYVAEVRINRDANQVWKLHYGYRDGSKWVDANSALFVHPGGSSTYASAFVAWAPHVTRTSNVYLWVESQPNVYDPFNRRTVSDYYIDSVKIYRSLATALDVVGTVKTAHLDVRSAVTANVLHSLAGHFLSVHGKDRLAGTLTVPVGGIERLGSGERIDPEQLQLYVDELVMIPWLIDPITKADGRVGRIASVSASEGVASVSVDERVGDLESLMGQMDVSVR